MSERGAPAAYRGYRLQALYTLRRILESENVEGIVFHPEGREDLDIRAKDGHLVEVIQVKSYDNLTLSNLNLNTPFSFFHRAVELLQQSSPPIIKLVNFGSIGPEIRQAWSGDAVSRSHVTKKFVESGLSPSDIAAIFNSIEIEQVNEASEEATVLTALRNLSTGVDPTSAFDILNFWLYSLSENRSAIVHADLIQRITNIGRFLSERYAYHREWFTSITPISAEKILPEQYALLREEFYAGVAARYEHIIAELDFRRERKLEEISQAFSRSQVVIIQAASGQGKTTLAYRYLHEAYPEHWRFKVELIQDRQHAASIASALAGHARAVQAPIAIYLDISPRDVDWPELVSRLARQPYLHILVTIRIEDFQRANISGVEFDFTPITLTFDEIEARLIYERASVLASEQLFLDFDEAWDRFGGNGPLLEFVYLLTQTVTLRERLRQQINRIRDEVRGRLIHPDELRLLRLISIAATYEARIEVANLAQILDLPELSRTLELFEKEYLIRLSQNSVIVEGLHPVRSAIIAELLIDSGIESWLITATQALPLIVEADLESFLLRALVDRPGERLQLLSAAQQLALRTWTGLAGVLRTLLWADVQAYVEANKHVIEQARDIFGVAWWIVVDLDCSDLSGNVFDDVLETFPVDQDRRAKALQIRRQQTPKAQMFERTKIWLSRSSQPSTKPSSIREWSDVAELCFRVSQLGSALDIEQWLNDENFIHLVLDLDLSTLAELSLGLYTYNPGLHAAWIQQIRSALESRLAQEQMILALEEREDVLMIHFLPSAAILDGKNSDAKRTNGKHPVDSLHAETLERIHLIRTLFPNYAAYGSQGYGFTLAGPPLPQGDSTRKDGIPISMLPPAWLTTTNSIAYGLGRYDWRPNTWSEYVEQALSVRRLTLTCLQQLIDGMNKYLQRNTAINLFDGFVDTRLWDQCRMALGERSLLPKPAVDRWGFGGEDYSQDRVQSRQQETFLPKALAIQKYQPYLHIERDYVWALATFFKQAVHVIIMNFHAGKLPVRSPEREKVIDNLEQKGLKTNTVYFTVHSLAEAQNYLPRYQQQFKELFGHIVSNVDLSILEQQEQKILMRVWQLWFFYAYYPYQKWASPQSQIPNQVSLTKRRVEQQFQQGIAKLTSHSTNVTILGGNNDWNDEPTFWLRLDLEDAVEYYNKTEELILALRETMERVDVQDLAHYVIDANYQYIAIVPVVRGRMLDRLAWKLYIFATILSDAAINEKYWSYVPQEIPDDNWKELGLGIWDDEDVVLANRLSGLVNLIAILVARMADLQKIPDVTEAGLIAAQAHLEMQADLFNEQLELVYNTVSEMVTRFGDLSESEQDARSRMSEAIGGLRELLQLVRPSEDSEGVHQLTIDEVAAYAVRMKDAQQLAIGIRFYWIADALMEARAG